MEISRSFIALEMTRWGNRLTDFYNFLVSWNLHMRYKIMLSKWSIHPFYTACTCEDKKLSEYWYSPILVFLVCRTLWKICNYFLPWANKMTATVQIILKGGLCSHSYTWRTTTNKFYVNNLNYRFVLKKLINIFKLYL